MTTPPQTGASRWPTDVKAGTAEPSGYAFGPYEADVRTGQLRRDGVVVPLSPKSLDVLVVLIRGRGQLVTKDELFREVWPDTVVEENNLARHISTLRKTLEEKLDDHRFIVTVPGRGYRFVAPVREVFTEPAPSPVVASVPLGEPGRAAAEPPESAVAAAPAFDELQSRPPASTVAALSGSRPSRRSSVWTYALGVLLAATAVGAVVWLYAHRATHSSATAPSLWQVTFDSGLKSDPTFSPDGERVAYAADRDDNADIWVRSVTGEGEATRLTSSPAHDWQPSWSPDGRTIAFRSERDNRGLYLVPAAGGEERQLTDFGYEPHWSPDGKSILFYNTALQTPSETPRIYIATLDERPPRELVSPGLAGFRSLRAAWHPDGRVSLWAVGSSGVRRLVTMRADGSDPVVSDVAPQVERRIAGAGLSLTDFVWAPSGRALYFEGAANGVANLWRVTVDPRTLGWIGGPDRLTTGAGRDVGIAVSPGGQSLAFSIRTERTRIWELPLDQSTGLVSGTAAPISAPEADASFPDVLPNGSRMIYRLARPGEEGLWERTGTGQAHLIVAAGQGEFVGFPRQSPDGRLLTYVRGKTEQVRQFPAPWSAITGNGTAEIVMRDADGRTRLLARGAGTFLVTDFVNGGESVIGYCRERADTQYSICRMSTSTTGVNSGSREVLASLPGHNLFGARSSPDGRWISFTAIDVRAPSQAAIYVMPAAGGHLIRVTKSATFNDKVRWAADSTALYFVSNRSGLFNVWRTRFDPTTGIPAEHAVQVTHFDRPGLTLMPSLAEMALGLTLDRLFLPLTESTGQIWVLGNLEH